MKDGPFFSVSTPLWIFIPTTSAQSPIAAAITPGRGSYPRQADGAEHCTRMLIETHASAVMQHIQIAQSPE